MKAILERRSIRKYTGKPIPKEIVTEILRAGMSAPSAGNERPWQFLVLDDRDKLDGLSQLHPHAQMLKEASHAVIVCGDTSLAKYPDFWVQDCAAATENLLLAAQDLGIGSVWLGVYSNPPVFEGIRKFLGLAENILPFSIVSLGFPAERKETADRYDDDRVHWNKW